MEWIYDYDYVICLPTYLFMNRLPTYLPSHADISHFTFLSIISYTLFEIYRFYGNIFWSTMCGFELLLRRSKASFRDVGYHGSFLLLYLYLLDPVSFPSRAFLQHHFLCADFEPRGFGVHTHFGA
ncbi:hypothetical protein F4776DRAFT_131585 [Hypoxylon sp. NC0597]|nr:hypothetical protein F4776DRAFT_131585 [Hypoxylon sp. NC0597]